MSLKGKKRRPKSLAEFSLALAKENAKLRERLEAYEGIIKASGLPISSDEDLKTALMTVFWLVEIVAGRTEMAPIFKIIETYHPEVLPRVKQEVRQCLEEIDAQPTGEPERRPMIQ